MNKCIISEIITIKHTIIINTHMNINIMIGGLGGAPRNARPSGSAGCAAVFLRRSQAVLRAAPREAAFFPQHP